MLTDQAYSPDSAEYMPEIYQVMPSRIQRIIDDLIPVIRYERRQDIQLVYLYWLWAFNNLYVFSRPQLIQNDVESGLRKMLARVFFKEQSKLSKSQLKIIRKVVVSSNWSMDMVAPLVWALNTPSIYKTLQHAGTIYIPVIKGLKKHLSNPYGHFVNSTYIKKLLLAPEQGEKQLTAIDRAIRDTCRMANQLSMTEAVTNRLMVSKSQQQITAIHDEMVVLFNEYSYKLSQTDEFPSPPFAGTEHIIPIDNKADLLKEGREMKNCVGSYAKQVKYGNCYIYKVMEPQRATLSVSPDTGKVLELKLSANKVPRRQTYNEINEWLQGQVEV